MVVLLSPAPPVSRAPWQHAAGSAPGGWGSAKAPTCLNAAKGELQAPEAPTWEFFKVCPRIDAKDCCEHRTG